MDNERLTLSNDAGEEVEFDVLGIVDYDGGSYIILYPIVEDDTGEVVILEYIEEKDGPTYLSVDDDDLIEDIFAVFKEKYQDDYFFADDPDIPEIELN